MASPKRRTSHSRKNKRRAHDFLTATATNNCAHCGALARPHRVCASCGHYGDKHIIEVED